MPRGRSSSTYQVRAKFRAPLGFVFRWCTDYTPTDAKYEAEGYERRIVRRSAREVVYEDLESTKQGWSWSHHVVRLLPPNRWYSNSVGSHRSIRLDYRLTPLPGGSTQLTLTARRTPYGLGTKNPTKAEWERSVALAWKRFGRALERDFRRAASRHPRK